MRMKDGRRNVSCYLCLFHNLLIKRKFKFNHFKIKPNTTLIIKTDFIIIMFLKQPSSFSTYKHHILLGISYYNSLIFFLAEQSMLQSQLHLHLVEYG